MNNRGTLTRVWKIDEVLKGDSRLCCVGMMDRLVDPLMASTFSIDGKSGDKLRGNRFWKLERKMKDSKDMFVLIRRSSSTLPYMKIEDLARIV